MKKYLRGLFLSSTFLFCCVPSAFAISMLVVGDQTQEDVPVVTGMAPADTQDYTQTYISDEEYQSQKEKQRVDETVVEIRKMIRDIRSLFINRKNIYTESPYKEMDKSLLVESGAVPSYMVYGRDPFAKDTDKNPNPWGYTLLNIWGGGVEIEAVGEKFGYNFFKITYTGLPKDACVGLLTADWGDEFLGNIWLGANGKYFSWNKDKAKDLKIAPNDLPISFALADKICHDGSYFQLGYR